jgi:hypothetical protein
MKVAIVHDQLQEFGGAERVLVTLKKIFPEADVFTSFYNPKTLGSQAKIFNDWPIITSWAEKVPFLKKLYSPLDLSLLLYGNVLIFPDMIWLFLHLVLICLKG